MSNLNFDNNYEDIKTAASGSEDWLKEGVYLFKVSGVEHYVASTNNAGIKIFFETPFKKKDESPIILDKTYYITDKNMGHMHFDFDRLKTLRELVWKVFGVKFEDYFKFQTSTPLEEINNLDVFALNLKKLIMGKEACVTVSYPSNPGSNGKYYLEAAFINNAKDFEFWKGKYVPKGNPNTDSNKREAGLPGIPKGLPNTGAIKLPGLPKIDDDLPF